MPSGVFTYVNPSPSSFVDRGPLHGMAIAIQPSISVRGWPAEVGSLALKGFSAIEDATVIERLKNAGASLVGSTKMSELGLGLNGDTAGRILAEGKADVVLMVDMMGEGRIVASLVGAYGIKPTNGIVSRYGLIGLVPSMECISILTRNATCLATVMDVITGYDERDFSMDDTVLSFPNASAGENTSIRSIGVVKEYIEILNVEESKVFFGGIEKLLAQGYTIREVSLPDFYLFRDVHHIVGAVEASSSCGKYDGVRYGHRTATAKNWNDMYLKSRCESFSVLMKTYLFQGAYFQFENYAAFEKAGRIRARMLKEINDVFTGVDALTFATSRKQAHQEENIKTVGDIYHDCLLTLPANVMGLPAIQIPGFIHDENTDFGIQIMGPPLSDSRLLSLAARLSFVSQGVG
jgi:aspartyl-tRNA(Asn)/glutamyl-tRNA(Gln) amidotransferase subunit A